MDYLRGLRLFREDPEWVSKVLIGSVLMLSAGVIPLLGHIVLIGWSAAIVRRAALGRETPLPRLDFDLDDLTKLLGTGFKILVAMLLWSLPATLLIGSGVMCLYLGAFFAVFGGAAAGGDAGAGIGGMGLLCAFGVGLPLLMLFGLLVQLPMQMAAIRVELSDNLNSALEFGVVLEMTKRVLRELVIGSLVLAFVQWLMMMGSLLLCGLPIIPCTILMMIARAHFAAQLYQRYLERGGAPIEIAHTEDALTGYASPPRPS